MTEISLATPIRQSVKSTFGVTESQVDLVLSLFNSVLKPEIQKNYLSHLKSALEDLVNERKKREFIERIKQDSAVGPEAVKSIENMLKLRQIRPFTILLQPIDSGIRKATTRIIQGSALILYYKNLNDKQKRVVIAHELGHLALTQLKSNIVEVSEKVVNLFASIAMIDKNTFYKSDSSHFTYENDLTIIGEIESLCKSNIGSLQKTKS